MRPLPIFIVFLFIQVHIFGQNIPKVKGAIEIKVINHHCLRDQNEKLTKKYSNKKKLVRMKLFFNHSGLLLNSITYGKRHDMNLKLVDNIQQNIYESDSIHVKTNIWESDYHKNISFSRYVLYSYDSLKNLIKETSFKDNSIYSQTNYWYDNLGNYQGLYFDSSYYYEREYDTLKRIISLRQIYKSKKRWEWVYVYEGNRRIGTFTTYYQDGTDRQSIEILSFEKDQIKEFEIRDVKKDNFRKKLIYYYSNGIIRKIEEYQAFIDTKEYQLNSFTEYIIRPKKKFNAKTLINIHREIIGEL